MASSSIKRQRKRKRTDQDGDPEFQVAPMVDVLLVLMLFFMAITSTEVLKKNPNLILPEAAHGKKPAAKQKDVITINIGWDKANKAPQYSMNGNGYRTADAMSGDLATQRTANPRAYVLIRADAEVEYSSVADLMNACAAAGIGTVTFAVIQKVGKAAATADAAAGAGDAK
jgi:biopolymer transport protein ExbD